MFKNLLLLVTIGTLMAVAVPSAVLPSAHGGATITVEDDTEDVVIFSSGRIVRGDILEQTESTIVMMVRIGSMPPVRTVYQMDEVLEIQRDVPRESAGGGRGDAEKQADADSAESIPGTNTRGERINDETTLFYYAELKGIFEKDLTETPLRNLFADVDRVFDDLVPVPNARGGVTYRVDETRREKHIVLLKLNARTLQQGFDGLFAAEKVAPVFKDEIQKGRRIVFWVENATGGAAFIPWLSPEMYFTPQPVMGLAGDLDKFDIGDEEVNLKQISLRMGHAEGLVIYGGYGRLGVAIIQAMSRSQYWFFVRLGGVEPEYYISMEKPGPEIMNNPQWEMLSDNGRGEYEDDPDTELYGNDVLFLRGDWPLKLGIAQGVATSIEDIALNMRVFRNYAVMENTRAERILNGWTEEIDRALANFGRIMDEANNVRIGGGRDAMMAALGQRQRLLLQARGILRRFAEVMDPDGSQRAQIDVMIEQVRAQMRNTRGGGPAGGGGGAGGPGGAR
ncbi:MAG: hypothetical protein ACNA8P_04900 [Phycisphaerales bacterium]